MKHFTKIAVVLTLIAALLSMTVGATVAVGNTDEKTGWGGGKEFIETEGGPVNGIAVGESTTAGNPSIITHSFTEPLDLSAYEEDGYLHMMLYVKNLEYFQDNGQIELTSSGKCDVQEITWNAPFGDDLKEGWNELFLPIFNATVADDVDFSAINFFRIYWFTAADADFANGGAYYAIDDLYVGQYGPADIMYPNSDVQWDALTTVDMSAFQGAVTNQAGVTDLVLKNSSLCITSNVLAAPMDLTKYEDGYLHLYLYVEDIEALDAGVVGQLELTSSGKCDEQETTFVIDAANLETGWNELTLSIAEADASGADLSAINFIRFYKHVTADTTIMIRGLAFGSEEELDMVPETTAAPETEPETTAAPAVEETTAAEGDAATEEAPADDASSSNGTTTYIIIGVVAALVVIIAIIAVVLAKKKKK